MSKKLFPMRMTSIEKLHFFDDRLEFPNNIFARCYFVGEIDREIAENALRISASRHVWDKAFVRKSASGLTWDSDSDNPPQFVWVGAGAYRYEPIDLTVGPVCRMVVRAEAGRSEVTFQVHHAVVDGLGGLQYLRDWLVVYDNLATGRDAVDRLPQVDQNRIASRNDLGMLRVSYWLTAWRQAIGLFGAAKFMLRRFAVIGRERMQAVVNLPRNESFPAFQTVVMDPATLKSIRAFTRAAKVPLNAWLLAAIFRALDQLPKDVLKSVRGEWNRIIVPINLRGADDRTLPAANRASLVQIDRRSDDTVDQLALAQGIAYELGLIRAWQLDRMFLMFVRALSVSPKMLERSVRRGKPRATTMLTNVGKPLVRTGAPTEGGMIRTGGVLLEAIDVVGPIRAGMPISLAVLEYAGSLRMSIHYDSVVLKPEEVEEFREIVRANILAPSR